MRVVADVVMSQYRVWIGIACLCSVAAVVPVSTPWVPEDSLTDSFFLSCAAEVFTHFRAAAWWPHWFLLP